MKKNVFKILFVMLFLITISFTIVFKNNINVLANETTTDEVEEVVEPSLNIYKKNVSYSSEIYIMYAVSYEGIDTSVNPIKMLFYDSVQEEYTKATATYVVETSGTATIGGVKCLVFASKGLAAKQMTDDIYARAYVEIGEEIIYSEVVKYSVLDYYYEVKGAGTATTNILNLLEAMINYGAAAQINFNYNIDKLANATYYKVSVENAVLPDGFTSGRFKSDEQVTLTAPEKEGYLFTGWTNSNGEVVSTEVTYTLTVVQDETLTANYEKEVAVTPITLTLTKEAAYDATASTLDLPTTVTFDYNNETVTENVTWDTTPFVVNQIGKQKLYGTLSNDSYKVDELSIEIDILPYTFSLNETTNEYSITKYYGTSEEETIPYSFNNMQVSIINASAFSNASTLKYLSIFSNIKNIGENVFNGCTSLENVYYYGTIENWCNIIFENFYSNPMCNSQKIYMYDENKNLVSVTQIIIPNTITLIGNFQFLGFSTVTDVEIPETITSIGTYAFYSCTNLTKVVIPSSVKNLLYGAFSFCSGLISIIIKEGVTNFEDFVFYGCESLTNIIIPSSIISISNGLFAYCSNLASVEISEGVSSIGVCSFEGCISLESITIPNSVINFGDGAFYNCSSLTSIEIPEGVTSIGNYVFENCSSLTNVYNEGTIESWCNISFSYDASNPMYYADHFYMKNEESDWYEVTEIVIPNTITKIGDYQFYGFNNVISITIPSSLTSMGNYAFIDCSSLTSITISNSVTKIGYSAFHNCNSLVNVYYEGIIESWCNILFNDFYSNPMYYAEYFYMKNEEGNWYKVTEIIIPNTITKIGDYQFHGFENVTSITIPSSVTSIGDNAFYNCSSVTGIEIPEGVTSIGISVFEKCSSLTSLEIPNSVTSIGSSAFEDCSSLTSITISNSVTSIGGNAFYNCSSLTSIEIPSSVTSIGGNAFYNCSSLTSIEIPSSVTSIGDNAFYNCSSLTSIEIPEGVTSIGDSAFEKCSSLISIEILEGVTSIGDYAFSECNSLTNITMSESIEQIGGFAFNMCNNLENVYYQGTIESWCNIAFRFSQSSNPMVCATHFYMLHENSEYYELTEIEIPNTITSIGCYQFSGFENITSVKISEGVTSIGAYAFWNCSSLTSIEIPEGITSIENGTFLNCSSITSIIIPEEVTSIGLMAFQECIKLKTIYNLSALELSIGSTDYGCVAYYAEVIYTTLPEEE